MIGKLKHFERTLLKDLLMSDNVWESLDIDYHPPFVKRLWVQLDEDHRLLLHEIHPCQTDEALLHPHPWQSAMHVLPIGGVYEHGMGYRDNSHWAPKDVIVSTQEVHGEMYYEMVDKQAIHYVRPMNGCVYTVMLTGPLEWPDHHHKASKELQPLSKDEKDRLLGIFRKFFEVKIEKYTP